MRALATGGGAMQVIAMKAADPVDGHADPGLVKTHRPVLPGVPSLRGWAATLVVIAHVDGMMGKPRYFGETLFGTDLIGGFGVSVFFGISGFIIALVSLNGRLAPRMKVAAYAKRRFERIVPFLWISVIGYNILHAIAADFEWAPALRAMLAWPVGELRPNVVWSLRHELIFYILFAWAMLLPRRRPALLVAWCLSPLIAFPLEPGVARLLGPGHADLLEFYQVLFCGSQAGANLQFGVGLLIAIAYLRGPDALRERVRFGPVLCLLAAAAGAGVAQVSAVPIGLGRAVLWTSLAAPIVLLGVVVATPRSGPLHRLGLLLGNASFAIYLTHNPVALILLEGSRSLPGLSKPLFFLVATFAALAAGIAIHLLVESPLLRLVSRRRVPVAAVDAPAILGG